MLHAVLAECRPGMQLEEYAIAGDGLHPARVKDVAARPCVLLSEVESARARGDQALMVGRERQTVASLLGEAQTLSEQLRAAAAKVAGHAIGGDRIVGEVRQL